MHPLDAETFRRTCRSGLWWRIGRQFGACGSSNDIAIPYIHVFSLTKNSDVYKQTFQRRAEPFTYHLTQFFHLSSINVHICKKADSRCEERVIGPAAVRVMWWRFRGRVEDKRGRIGRFYTFLYDPIFFSFFVHHR